MRPEYHHQLDDLFLKVERLEAVVRSQQQTIVSQQQVIEVQQERIKQLAVCISGGEEKLVELIEAAVVAYMRCLPCFLQHDPKISA